MPLLCGEIFSLRMFWLIVQSGVPRLTGNQVHVYAVEKMTSLSPGKVSQLFSANSCSN